MAPSPTSSGAIREGRRPFAKSTMSMILVGNLFIMNIDKVIDATRTEVQMSTLIPGNNGFNADFLPTISDLLKTQHHLDQIKKLGDFRPLSYEVEKFRQFLEKKKKTLGSWKETLLPGNGNALDTISRDGNGNVSVRLVHWSRSRNQVDKYKISIRNEKPWVEPWADPEKQNVGPTEQSSKHSEKQTAPPTYVIEVKDENDTEKGSFRFPILEEVMDSIMREKKNTKTTFPRNFLKYQGELKSGDIVSKKSKFVFVDRFRNKNYKIKILDVVNFIIEVIALTERQKEREVMLRTYSGPYVGEIFSETAAANNVNNGNISESATVVRSPGATTAGTVTSEADSNSSMSNSRSNSSNYAEKLLTELLNLLSLAKDQNKIDQNKNHTGQSYTLARFQGMIERKLAQVQGRHAAGEHNLAGERTNNGANTLDTISQEHNIDRVRQFTTTEVGGVIEMRLWLKEEESNGEPSKNEGHIYDVSIVVPIEIECANMRIQYVKRTHGMYETSYLRGLHKDLLSKGDFELSKTRDEYLEDLATPPGQDNNSDLLNKENNKENKEASEILEKSQSLSLALVPEANAPDTSIFTAAVSENANDLQNPSGNNSPNSDTPSDAPTILNVTDTTDSVTDTIATVPVLNCRIKSAPTKNQQSLNSQSLRKSNSFDREFLKRVVIASAGGIGVRSESIPVFTTIRRCKLISNSV